MCTSNDASCMCGVVVVLVVPSGSSRAQISSPLRGPSQSHAATPPLSSPARGRPPVPRRVKSELWGGFRVRISERPRRLRRPVLSRCWRGVGSSTRRRAAWRGAGAGSKSPHIWRPAGKEKTHQRRSGRRQVGVHGCMFWCIVTLTVSWESRRPSFLFFCDCSSPRNRSSSCQ